MTRRTKKTLNQHAMRYLSVRDTNVRFYLQHKGKTTELKYFTFEQYGSRQKTIKAAQAYRDKVLKQYPQCATKPYGPKASKKELSNDCHNLHIEDAQNGIDGHIAVNITHGGKKTSQSFTYQNYGGQKKALQAAKAYRDKIAPKVTKGYALGLERLQFRKRNSSNTSGVIGVCFSPSRNAWMAYWAEGPIDNRKPKSATYNVNKYSYQKAYELAVKRRKREIKINRVTDYD